MQFTQLEVELIDVVDIPLNKLIPHESSAVESRIRFVRGLGDSVAPILVKPILDGYYYICQGHNRAYNALQNGAETIKAVVGTLDSLRRREEIARLRIAQDAEYPLRALCLDPDDLSRQDRFYQDSSHLSAQPFLRSNRGTIVRLAVKLTFGGVEFRVKSLPMKGRVGGVIFNPELAAQYLRLSVRQDSMIEAAWGPSNNYMASVLPSFVELSVDGLECRAAGYPLDDAFFDMEDEFRFERNVLMDTKERATIREVFATVIYPDGNIWEGPLGISSETGVAMLWDDRLIRSVASSQDISSYFAPTPWWQCATSIVIRRNGGKDTSTLSCMSSHSCGSTCVGGGCLI